MLRKIEPKHPPTSADRPNIDPSFEQHSLDAADRGKLADLDARAADAIDQMGLDDNAAFQACLEARRPAQRAEILLRGVQREAERLGRRAALKRALDMS